MARRGYEQPSKLPTVSQFTSHEVTRLLVICRSDRIPGYPCHHERTLPLEGLPDVDLVALPRQLRFRCSKCDRSKVYLPSIAFQSPAFV
jgi:hypothetical protein